MATQMDRNNFGIKQGDNISGYSVKQTGIIDEIDSFFYELEHTDTCARHFHISNQDTENWFTKALCTMK